MDECVGSPAERLDEVLKVLDARGIKPVVTIDVKMVIPDPGANPYSLPPGASLGGVAEGEGETVDKGSGNWFDGLTGEMVEKDEQGGQGEGPGEKER